MDNQFMIVKATFALAAAVLGIRAAAAQVPSDRPELKGSLDYLGQMLQGLVASTFNGARGFATETAEGGAPENYVLPAMTTVTTIDIANAVITLRPKGVWLLEEVPISKSKLTEVRLSLASYDKGRYQIERMRCSSADDQ